jgi:hypothetical protein
MSGAFDSMPKTPSGRKHLASMAINNVFAAQEKRKALDDRPLPLDFVGSSKPESKLSRENEDELAFKRPRPPEAGPGHEAQPRATSTDSAPSASREDVLRRRLYFHEVQIPALKPTLPMLPVFSKRRRWVDLSLPRHKETAPDQFGVSFGKVPIAINNEEGAVIGTFHNEVNEVPEHRKL